VAGKPCRSIVCASERFRTIISGYLNATGTPSANMAGYTVP
jgi:hypothetical protein